MSTEQNEDGIKRRNFLRIGAGAAIKRGGGVSGAVAQRSKLAAVGVSSKAAASTRRASARGGMSAPVQHLSTEGRGPR